MKTLQRILAAISLLAVASALSVTCMAQEVATPAPVSPEVGNFVTAFITNLATNHPWVATVITIIGSMRLWAKPAVSILHQIVNLTPSDRDNTLLNTAITFFATHPVGKVLAYLLDWMTSIKITPVQPKTDL